MTQRGSENGTATIVRGGDQQGRREDTLFNYFVRRRDGERPLAICSAIVALLTLWLGVRAATTVSDWRPVGFYGVFCLLTLLSTVILTLQWKNDELVATDGGLVHFDWRRRPAWHPWSEVTRAVETSRPGNRRLTLSFGSTRSIVIHDDFPAYGAVAATCREQLARVGQVVEVG